MKISDFNRKITTFGPTDDKPSATDRTIPINKRYDYGKLLFQAGHPRAVGISSAGGNRHRRTAAGSTEKRSGRSPSCRTSSRHPRIQDAKTEKPRDGTGGENAETATVRPEYGGLRRTARNGPDPERGFELDSVSRRRQDIPHPRRGGCLLWHRTSTLPANQALHPYRTTLCQSPGRLSSGAHRQVDHRTGTVPH